ncbi:hypothetical protein GQX74_012963 [Glossina fuscipes]|nr:hypothetical protein GQX74_012963 [Glossina fuscipes]
MYIDLRIPTINVQVAVGVVLISLSWAVMTSSLSPSSIRRLSTDFRVVTTIELVRPVVVFVVLTAVVTIGIKTSLAKVWCILISAGLMLTQLEEATLFKAERPTSYKSLLVLLLLTTSIDGNSSSSVRYKRKKCTKQQNAQHTQYIESKNTKEQTNVHDI